MPGLLHTRIARMCSWDGLRVELGHDLFINGMSLTKFFFMSKQYFCEVSVSGCLLITYEVFKQTPD